jgi:hypothetical protein
MVGYLVSYLVSNGVSELGSGVSGGVRELSGNGFKISIWDSSCC